MNAAEPFDPETRAPDHSHFSYPEEVVESQILEPEEKRRILLQWLEDEKALFVADDEGMQGNRPTQIEQVHQALRTVRAIRKPDPSHRSPLPATDKEKRMVIPHFRFDSSISAGGQLSRKDIDRLAREGFRSILNLSEEGESGQLLSPNVEATWAHANAMEHGRVSVSVDHLHSHWVDRFLEALDELPRPVYVHSETGRRAAAFLTIKMALDRHLSADQALREARSLGMECDLEALKRFVRADVERRRL